MLEQQNKNIAVAIIAIPFFLSIKQFIITENE